jgi:hypothetical protein
MAETLFIAFGLVVVFSSIVFLALSENQKAYLSSFVSVPFVRGRKTSISKTPPRSVTPEKKAAPPASNDYKEMLPPSRRASLANCLTPIQARKLSIHITPASPVKGGCHQALETPLEEGGDYTYTATEFTKEEVAELGDFPDYAELSGVPLPKVYEGFNVETARPRPYRPFRWEYHQTMCKFLFLLTVRLTHVFPSCAISK